MPIWGFSTTGAPALPTDLDPNPATAPGPVLVVHQGDAVSITLHNQLSGERVSLALPGQNAPVLNGWSPATTSRGSSPGPPQLLVHSE